MAVHGSDWQRMAAFVMLSFVHKQVEDLPDDCRFLFVDISVWNVQICCLMSLQYLCNALIIHYFNVSWERMRTIYILANPEIQKKGFQSKEVQHIIEHPKEAIAKAAFLRSDSVTDEVMYCKAFSMLKCLYAKHPLAYRGINYMLSIPSRIRKGMSSKRHERKTIE